MTDKTYLTGKNKGWKTKKALKHKRKEVRARLKEIKKEELEKNGN